jgi:integrase/recombinase XerD
MIEDVFRSVRVRRRLRLSLLGLPIFEALTAHLAGRSRSITTVQQYVQNVEHFDRWLRRSGRPVTSISEDVVTEFLRVHLPSCRCSSPACTTLTQVRAAVRQLQVVLQARGVIAPVQAQPKRSPGSILVDEFTAYLRDVRGAAPATCGYYGRYAREFLGATFGDGAVKISRVQPSTVPRFIGDRSTRWTTDSMKTAATALRSFFRFLQVAGRATERHVLSVPTIPHWRLASIPRILSDDQVKAILASFDRTTASGLRGYAMTMCLAELGLRACEVAALTIDDFSWRAGTLAVPPTKARRADVLPLPQTVARAVLAYLRKGRPRSKTRRVFVRHVAPVGAPAGPAMVRQAVRLACARTGLDPRLGGPHVFRHTVATRLLRSGATIKEVADVLRHRTIDTAAIYAKVDLRTLRLVALPWPGGTP